MPASPAIEVICATSFAWAVTACPEVDAVFTSSFTASAAAPSASAQVSVVFDSSFAAVIPVPRLVAPAPEFTSAFTVSGAGVVTPARATIRAVIRDVLAQWGQGCCTGPPDECALAEAVRAVNAGLQQFYHSARAHEFLVVTKEVRYSWSPPGENAFKMFSLTGVDLPSPLATDDVLGNTTRHFQHISRVTYSYTPADSDVMRTVLLRPAASSAQAGALAGITDANPGSTLLEWFDTPANDIPTLYEVFRGEDGHPKIRGYPFRSRTGTEFASVTYYEAAAPVTALDYNNGAALDIGNEYVELLLMPLVRHAALSSRYMDPRATAQAKAIEDRYQEALQYLGLSDFQTPELVTQT